MHDVNDWIKRRHRLVGTLLIAPLLALSVLPAVTTPVAAQLVDSDADGLFDDDELVIYGTDPLNPDPDECGNRLVDTDGDGVAESSTLIGRGPAVGG